MIVTHDSMAIVSLKQPIEVWTWTSDMLIGSLSLEVGMGMIARSGRFDDRHCTATVRTLSQQDCDLLHEQFGVDLTPEMPILFKQDV